MQKERSSKHQMHFVLCPTQLPVQAPGLVPVILRHSHRPPCAFVIPQSAAEDVSTSERQQKLAQAARVPNSLSLPATLRILIGDLQMQHRTVRNRPRNDKEECSASHTKAKKRETPMPLFDQRQIAAQMFRNVVGSTQATQGPQLDNTTSPVLLAPQR